MTEGRPPFHVLALSGGGVRGLYTARLLEMLEAHWKTPIARRFDLICGTSIGGILGMGLALERPASELKNLLLEGRKQIFGSASWWRRAQRGWIFAKHSTGPLQGVLRTVFADHVVGDLPHPVVIPVVDASTGKAAMFKTPHSPDFSQDHKRTLVEVALATSAAPTYFPVSRSNDQRLFVDGGLIANAPGLCGLHEAEKFFGRNAAEVRVLAIGTASVGRNVRSRGGWLAQRIARLRPQPNGADVGLDLGILRWGSRVFDLTISAQESLTDFMLKHRLDDRYVRVDSTIDTSRSRDIQALDATSDAAAETLLAAASSAGQSLLGSRELRLFSEHTAGPPTFYYGRHAKP